MPSRGAPLGASRLLLISWCFCVASIRVSARISEPTDNLDSTPGTRRYALGTKIPSVDLYPLTPNLTQQVRPDSAEFKLRGNLLNVGPENSGSIKNDDIAFISCDDSHYVGHLGVDETIEAILGGSPHPSALLLYTTKLNRCTYSHNLTAHQLSYVFSLVNSTVAQNLRQDLIESPREVSTIMGVDVIPATNSGSGGTNRNTAMIILYTVTGVITALFLGVILTGAVRAHRHPERYGPRNIPGRPRQSRAKGIARALLETLPIVKFSNESDKAQPQKADLEMNLSHGDHELDDPDPPANETPSGQGPASQPMISRSYIGDACEDEESTSQPTAGYPPRPSDVGSNQIGPARTAGVHSFDDPRHGSNAGTLVCPICTDEFIQGQDVRLLPCDHKFHPECVDPWLVNVSGTCPLCRIDLNPHEEKLEEPEEPEEPEEHTDGSQTISPRAGGSQRNVNNGNNNVVADRIREARRLRDTSGQDLGTAANTERQDENRRRIRLSVRLRGKFRIRTAQHGNDPPLS
ncbi:hypothetical protein FQN57_001603 [Myotisia sp. PD_48]|nr:hypothetical protein FQN57_001603 [Myotisia sp. PD_48]